MPIPTRSALLLSALVGCAPAALTLSADHPANPAAPTGRLAGPPAALRPGVVDAPPVQPATGHEGHH